MSAAWHMIGSGFYINTTEAVLLVVLILGVMLAHRLHRLPRPQSQRALAVAPLIALLFVCLKGLAT